MLNHESLDQICNRFIRPEPDMVYPPGPVTNIDGDVTCKL